MNKYIRMGTLFIVLAGIMFLSGHFTYEQPADYKQQSTVSKINFIYDGDTIRLNTGEKVRLIGIDAPEREEPFYEQSKQYLLDRLLNRRVTLVQDVSDRDKYGRLLRYIYLDDELINKTMIREGYARVLTVPPDVKYADILFQAQQEAREQGRGLWKNTK